MNNCLLRMIFLTTAMLITQLAPAQPWNIYTGTGVSVISAPPGNQLFGKSKGSPTMPLSLRLSYKHKHIETGLAVDITSFNRKATLQQVDINQQPTGTQEGKVFIGKPCIAIAPFARFTANQWAVGAKFGTGIFGSHEDDPSAGKRFYEVVSGASVFFGINLMYCRPISKSWGVFIETSANYWIVQGKLYAEYPENSASEKVSQFSLFFQYQTIAGFRFNM